MNHANKTTDPCNDEECKFCHSPEKGMETKCCFGGRNTIGCIQEDPAVQDICNEILGLIKTNVEQGTLEKGMELINRRNEKMFDFVYNGHHYTASDNARTQSTCPHCGYKNPSGNMFKPTSPGIIFLGSIDFGSHTAECFECKECFHKFYYHL